MPLPRNRSISLSTPSVQQSRLATSNPAFVSPRTASPSLLTARVNTRPTIFRTSAQAQPVRTQEQPGLTDALINFAAEATAQAANWLAQRETALQARDAYTKLTEQVNKISYGYDEPVLQPDGSTKTTHRKGYLELTGKEAWSAREAALQQLKQAVDDNMPSSPAAQKSYLAQATYVLTSHSTNYNKHASAGLTAWEQQQLNIDLANVSNELAERSLAAVNSANPIEDIKDMRNYIIDSIENMGQLYSVAPDKLLALRTKTFKTAVDNIAALTDPTDPSSYKTASAATEAFHTALGQSDPLTSLYARQKAAELRKRYNEATYNKTLLNHRMLTEQKRQNDIRAAEYLYDPKSQAAQLAPEEAARWAREAHKRGTLSTSMFKAIVDPSSNANTTPAPQDALSTAIFNVTLNRTVDGRKPETPSDIMDSINELPWRAQDKARVYNVYRTYQKSLIRSRRQRLQMYYSQMLDHLSPSQRSTAEQFYKNLIQNFNETVVVDKNGAVSFTKDLDALVNETLKPYHYLNAQFGGKGTELKQPSELQVPALRKKSAEETAKKQISTFQEKSGMSSAPEYQKTEFQLSEIQPEFLPPEYFGKSMLRYTPADGKAYMEEITTTGNKAAALYTEGRLPKDIYENIMNQLRLRIDALRGK